MRVGIDVRELKRGIYTGLRTILSGFLTDAERPEGVEIVFFGNQYTDFASIPAEGKKVVIEEKNTFLWDQLLLPKALKRENVDVFFSLYVKTPLWRTCPYVNTVCDIIPLSVSKYKGVKSFLERVHFFLYTFLCAKRAVRVITLSEDSGNKISRIFGVKKDKLRVIYPSVEMSPPQGSSMEDAEVIQKYDLYKPYILYVGNYKPHKNLERLIDAYSLLPEEVKDEYRLFLVGGGGSEARSLEAAIARKNLQEKIVLVKNIEHSNVFAFLKNASVFVFPSLAEGFGIPPVEAMAAGVPVASSNLAPMTEVLAEAALFFDPRDVKDISLAILRLLTERGLKYEYIMRGEKRIKLLSDRKMSREIWRALEEAGEEKTLCISSEFPPTIGGIATQVFNLWKNFPKKEVIILTARVKGDSGYFDGGLDVVRRKYPTGSSMCARVIRSFLVVWYAWQISRLRNIRSVHCAQVLSSGLAGLFLKKIRHLPYVVYVYSADVLEFGKCAITRKLMEKILAESGHIIANSNFTKGLITDRALAPEEKITVLTPAVDIEKFTPERGDYDIRQKHGIPRGVKMLLTVSRLAPRKGHESVIKAFAGVLEKHASVVYVIVGDGPEKEKLVTLVKELGLSKNVIFLAGMPGERLALLYNTSDIFIMAPRYIEEAGDVEGFGIVFLEASACGKAVIAGRSGGVAEAVVDGQTGILVDPEDVTEIRDTILRLLEDEKYAEKLGSNGFTRVRQEFRWKSRSEELKKYM